MSKEYFTSNTGASQTLNASDQSKIKIYDSKIDMDTDISNIAENEIVATKAGESEGVVEVTDVVEDGNMNPVSSNAVFEALIPLIAVAKVSKYTAKTSSSSGTSFTFSDFGTDYILMIGSYGGNLGSDRCGGMWLARKSSNGYYVSPIIPNYSNSNGVFSVSYNSTGITITSISGMGNNSLICFGIDIM